jgi:predicted XRE-type DNA-binding protein
MIPIPNFPDYFVDREGNIWSKKPYRNNAPIPKEARKLKPIKIKEYLYVNLYKNNIIHTKRIPRLVLETFIGPCPVGMESCHNDGNNLNNKVSNLRWDTPKSNSQDRIKHGTQARGEKHGMSKLNDEVVKDIKYLLEKTKMKQWEIAEIFGVDQTTISRINIGKQWSHI